MTAESEEVRRAIEAARKSGDEDAAATLEGYFSQLSGPALSRQHRMDKIAGLDQEIEDVTVAKDRNDVGSYWGGLAEAAKPRAEGPPLEQIQSLDEMGREVNQPLLDPMSRTGQTLTSFEVGVKRQLGDYFNRKDSAIKTRDNIYEHVYNQLSPAEQERMKAPRHWGWDYDSYKNMPFPDFKAALEKGGEFGDQDWQQLLGEDLYKDMMSGDDPMAKEAGGFYRFFVQPWLSDGEMKPSERLYQSVENARKNWYSDETRKSLDKPFVAEDASWYKPWSWFDETTKAPWEDWDGFYYSVAENTPQITSSIGIAGAGGRLGSRLSGLMKADKAEDLISLQQKMAATGGMVAGAGSEAIMIRDNVYAETSKRVEQLPDEKWAENPEYQQLVTSGFSEELAKQIVGQEVGLKAADTAMVVAGLAMGSPMSAFFGRRAAGDIGGAGSSFFSNMLRGAAGEGAQEGSQEAMEQFIGNLNVSYIDPEQRLTEGLGEAAAGGFFTGVGPGALGGLGSGDGPTAGFTDEQIRQIQAGLDIRRTMADRYKYEQEVTSEEPGREKSPQQRVDEYHKLERMQREEAETILDKEADVRSFIESQGGNEAELKMLSRLAAKARMTLADIDAAQARRTTAAQQLLEEQEIHKERARIEEAVTENLMKLEDVTRQANAIESVQSLEAIPEEMYAELRREGYGKWVGANEEKFVILPKGRRAFKELRRQAVLLDKKIKEGYAGPERRGGANSARRQIIDAASPEQREALLYQDSLTGIPNRRAFNERGQEAPVVAAVDVDSLKWINDNMGQHASGDRLLMNVANALRSQSGVDVYRLGGDEFAVTGESNKAVEAAMQAAAKKLQTMPIRNDRDEVIPTITWGKGETYEAADLEAAKRKRERAQSGKRAGRDKPPPSLRNRDQGLLFHLDDVQRDQAKELEQHFQRPIEEIDTQEAHDYLSAINFKQSPTKKLLVIHPQDQSTDFLKKIYKDLKNDDIDGVTVVNDELSKGELRKLINSHDRVMMMGHGSSSGLLNPKKPGNLIDNSMVDLLQKKDDSIFIWCHANEFCSKYDLKGFSTGMFISEEFEAGVYGVPHKGSEIDESNEAFADVMSRAVKLSSDQIYDAVKSEYGKLGSGVSKYNIEQMKTPLPNRWRQVSDIVAAGDDIEILTPDGAVIGVITSVKGGKNPRLKVTASGRDFTFNPKRNWLIVNDFTDPADLAWLTGDSEYAEPGRDTFPQTLSDVTIGHIGSDGNWIADLSDKLEYSSDPEQGVWWSDDYPEWNENIPWITKKATAFRDATEEEMAAALNVVNIKTEGFRNLPRIQLVDSMETLEKVAPETVAEARTMGVSFSGVRGFFDESRPDNGIILIVPNISGRPGSEEFDMNLTETLMHEMIGHYGVRGLFGNNNEELREYMHSVVDQFPEVEKIIRPKVPRRNMTADEHKQMVGEEMIAYVTGEMMAGKFSPKPKQRNFLQRFFEWVRTQMVRFGWLKPNQQTAREKFWNDDRVRDLVARSTDYVRSGKVNTPSSKTMQDTARYMRDMDIFVSGVGFAIRNATRSLSGAQRKQLAPKYGGKQNVPKEVPMFDEVASPNKYMDAIKKLRSDNKLSAKDLELTSLDPDGEWNFLRDTTYADLQQFMPEAEQSDESNWWRQVMPPNLARELDEMMKTSKAKFVTPIASGQGTNAPQGLSEAATQKKLNAEKRISEILTMKIDPKKTQLTKDILLNYLESEKVVRLYVDDMEGKPSISYERAAMNLFGGAAREEGFFDRLTQDEQEMIKEEVRLSTTRGLDVGFNENTQKWIDRTTRTTQYAEFSPQGSGIEVAGNYRVTYLIQEGGNLPRMNHSHFDGRQGVIAHIRSGLGTMVEIEGSAPIPTAPNPKMQGKTLVMVELQSDWIQRLRKGFPSSADHHKTNEDFNNSSRLLRRIASNFGEDTVAAIHLKMKELIEPITGLQDGSMNNRLEKLIRKSYPDGATEDQKESVYRALRDKLITKLSNDLSDATEAAYRYSGEFRDSAPLSDLLTTEDARTFERLDKMSVSNIAARMGNSLQLLSNTLLAVVGSEAQPSVISQQLSVAIDDSMRSFSDLTNSPEKGYMMRLPVAVNELKKMLVPVFDKIGVSEDVVNKIVKSIEQVDTASFRLPPIPVNTLMRESGSSAIQDQTQTIKVEVLSTDQKEAHGILPDGLTISVDVAPNNEYDITVNGRTEAIDKFREALPSMINAWAKEVAPVTWESVFGGGEKKRLSPDLEERDDLNYSWDQLKHEFDFSEIDITGEQNTDLDGYDVEGFYRWEENHLDEYRTDAVDAAFEEMEWDEVTNSDGESLSRSGSDYRDLLVVDEDGDVDNSDAEDWLRSARYSYRDELYEDPDVMDDASDRAHAYFFNDPPMLWVGQLPTEWDEGGDPVDEVEIAVVQTQEGDYAYIYIDQEDAAGNYATKQGAFDAVSKAVADYYQSNDIHPPAGKVFSPIKSPPKRDRLESLEESEELPSAPNFMDMAGAVIANMQVLKMKPQKSAQIFNTMVTAQKRLVNRGDIVTDTPFAPDKFWRTAALKYLIADAVRRGIPSIAWHPGSASTTRGGWGPDWVAEDRLSWSVEEIDIRGESQEVLVITTPKYRQPVMLAWNRAIGALGSDVVSHIQKQLRGELPATPSNEDPKVMREPSKNDYLLSRSGNWVAVHFRYNGEFMGFFNGEDAANEYIDKQVSRREESERRKAAVEPAEGGGRVVSKGEVTKKSLGGTINVSLPRGSSSYEHTFTNVPRSSSARKSYEVITKSIWEKELQKYDGKVTEHWVKVNKPKVARVHEGLVVKETSEREERVKRDHGHLEVKELTGDTHGWIIVSENHGIMIENVFPSQDEAQLYLDRTIDERYGEPSGATKVFYIEITDKMREEFSGPVTPFHYDPREDPDLKEAAEKIGYEPTKLRERIESWRQHLKDNFNQGMFDRFYGIKRATNRAGLSPPAESDPYIHARLTTSLDSVMRAVMEYGHPVWKEGIVQTEGRGLLDILQPVMGDIDLWGMYMAGVRAKRLFKEGRENLFTPEQIDAMVKLGDKIPVFKVVAAQYAAFNKKVLDFAEAAGVINKETRPLWENADHVPFTRVQDNRLIGPLSGSAGVVNQLSPIRRLKGGEANVGNIMHNILVNLTKLIDSSMKNHAALLAVDSLRDVGIISKKPMTHSQELIPLQQVKKLLIDRGMNPELIPKDALEGMQKMFAIQPPEGEGVISVLRDGKKEFYFTDDVILYRALTAINKKAWGQWMALMRAPKRLLTTMITLDPGFMIANYMRDSMSAFVLSRDNFVPVVGALKGFGQALVKDEAMRTMMSAGAAFENGYINQYDPKATERLIKKAMKKKSFKRTLLTSPAKLLEAWKAIGAATENANRIAVYQAAIRAGKGKARAVYEAKDLMDFSMGGDWPFIQFLIQTVPFMGARMQGLHRLGRGSMENPVGFWIKGTLVGLAGLALWFAFKDDERYKELEEWDKDTYFHWWIGDTHYRLPKGFEVGAIFNTIPERTFEYMYSQESDAGKLLMKRYGFMLAETFNMNPTPQAFQPMLESYFNYNFFQGRSIVSPYEERRMSPEQYRYTTSPTMIELARILPEGLDTASGKIRSPLHLQNLYSGYTGTLGRYFLMGADAMVRQQLDYPLPPAKDVSQYPVYGRFVRGEAPKRTKYEEEVYRLIDKTTAIQGSLSFLERAQLEGRMNEILKDQEPYIRVAESLEGIREDIRDINREIMNIYMDPEMKPEDKKQDLDMLQEQKNILFKEGFELRPGGKANPVRPLTETDVISLIDDFGINNSKAYIRHLQEQAPDTYELLEIIRSNMEKRNILSLAKASNDGT